MTPAEAWLRTRHPNLIIWNDDGSVNIDLSLNAVIDADTE